MSLSVQSNPVRSNHNIFFTDVKPIVDEVRKIFAIVPQYFSICKLRIEKGCASWKSPEKFRGVYRSLLDQQIKAVWDAHFKPNTPAKLLELGASFLDSEGSSYLSGFLPKGLNITFADLDPNAVADGKTKNVRYLQMNSCAVADKVEHSSFDVVMGSCFLDTLTNTELPKTLDQIRKILKKDGLFFHVSDLQPFINSILIHYKDHPDIMFPLIGEDGFFEGIQLVKRDHFVQFFNQPSQADQAEIDFLKIYFELPKDQRAALIIDLYDKKMAKTLSSLCVKHFGSNNEKIKNNDFFQKNITAHLESAGFQIMKCGVSLKQEIVSKETDDLFDGNDLAVFQGRMVMKKIDLQDGQVRKTLSIHVIVAKVSG